MRIRLSLSERIKIPRDSNRTRGRDNPRIVAMSRPGLGRRMLLAGMIAVTQVAIARGAENEESNRIAIAVEALSRLPGIELDQNPKVREAVLKVLAKTRGTPAFVKLVQQFKLRGQNEGLLAMAVADPSGEAGVDALRLILDSGELGLIKSALENTNRDRSLPIAIALGNAQDKRTTDVLLEAVRSPNRLLEVRKQAVRSLAVTSSGAAALLELAARDQLPSELRFTTSTELNHVRWPEIQKEAGKLLPLPQGQNSQPLPPIAELLKRKGDPVKGALIFAAPGVGCSTCHQVKGAGIDFGPNLSEVGSKLGKDALFESILDPSAGISFGFEAWQLNLKSGDEAYGLIASETADEIAIKAVGGVVTRYQKSAVAQREKMKLSIMPAGLQQAMSPQDLVDLVEYLASLKK